MRGHLLSVATFDGDEFCRILIDMVARLARRLPDRNVGSGIEGISAT